VAQWERSVLLSLDQIYPSKVQSEEEEEEFELPVSSAPFFMAVLENKKNIVQKWTNRKCDL